MKYIGFYFILLCSFPFSIHASIEDLQEEGISAQLQYSIDVSNSDSELILVRENLLKQHAIHQIQLMEIAETAYRTQHWITLAIFFLVSTLVLGGFYLSYLQFKNDSLQVKDSTGDSKASVEISKSGVKFSSSVIGLIVLFLSFMFFYLYVKEVYKIETHSITPAVLPNEESVSTEG